MSSDVAVTVTDGRVRRRHDNIDRVLDALCEIGAEGRLDAGPEQLCRRSGVSMRSLYRYFPDQEHLLLAAVQRQVDRSAHLYSVPDAGAGVLGDRVAAYVEQRLQLHGEMSSLAHLTRGAPSSMRRLRSALRERRGQLETMVRTQFAPELEQMSRAHRERAAVGVHVLCQRESIDTLLGEQGLSRQQAGDLLASGVTMLLTPERTAAA